MRVFTVAVLWVSAVLSLRAGAQTGCLDPQRVQEVQRHYAFQEWNATLNGGKGGFAPKTDFDTCNPDSLTYKVFQALIYIADLPPLASTGGRYEYNVLGDSAQDYFNKRIHTIFLERDGKASPCHKSVVAFVGSEDTPNSLHICPYADTFSAQSMSGTLLHEARHIDGFPHTMCEHGLFSIVGGFACDDAYETKGAYGVGVEYNVRLSRTQSIDPAVRQQARGMAISDLLERFNTLPLRIQPGMLLVSDAGDVTFFNNDMTEDFIHGLPANLQLSFYKGLPVLLDSASGTLQGFSPPGTYITEEGMLTQQFAALPQIKRAAVLDTYSGNYNCFLFSNSVNCLMDDASVDVPLPAGFHAANFIRFKVYGGSDIVMISSDNGAGTLGLPNIAYGGYQPGSAPAGSPQDQLKSWTTANLEVESSPYSGLRDFTSLSTNQIYAIRNDGTFVQQTAYRAWMPVPAFQARRFKHLLAPFYWSSEIEGL